MKNIYIVAAKRTPFGKYRGFFKDASAIDLGVMALKGALKDGNINPDKGQELFMGNVLSTGLGENMARQVALNSGMKEETTAAKDYYFFCSSLIGSRFAQGEMGKGAFSLVVGGVCASLSRAPHLV